MPYAIYQVARTCRQTRRTLDVLVSGIDQQTAGRLAQTLRAEDAENEALYAYSVQTMSLSAQIERAEAVGILLAITDPAPYALAA